LQGMPAAKGLFHRAIAMSGSQVRSLSPERASMTAEATLKQLNLTADSSVLQDMPFYELRDLLGQRSGLGGNLNFAPVMDSHTIPAHNFDPAATELSSDVPLMIGSTETEVTWNTHQQYDNLDAAALLHYVKRTLRSGDGDAGTLIKLYRDQLPQASNLDIYLQLATDASQFRRGTNLEAERKAAQQKAPVYKYYFNWYSPVRDGRLRSMHTMDIPFALDNVAIAHTEIGTDSSLQGFADNMSGAWVAFARTGSPNHDGIPAWPVFNLPQRPTMMLNTTFRVMNDPHGERQRAVDTLLKTTETRPD